MNEEERNALSIDHKLSKITPNSNLNDKAEALLKAITGAAPFIGPAFQEVISIIIPNRRIERIALMMEVFEQKVSHIEKEVLDIKVKSEEFTDLLEIVIPEASRAFSAERREYIASFLKNSLTRDELKRVYRNRLFELLSKINDAEIIVLSFYLIPWFEKDERKSFEDKHQSIFTGLALFHNRQKKVSDSEIEAEALRKNLTKTLLDLGLLKQIFISPSGNSPPEMDTKTGMLKRSRLEITELGRALLKSIDIKYNEKE